MSGMWTKMNISSGSNSNISASGGSGVNGVSNLNRKKWSCLGDSITEVNFRTNLHYHDYIAQWTGCFVNNYGKSGTGWFVPGSGQPFYQRISGIDSSSDIITVFGGINDWNGVGKTLVLGSYGDTNPAGSFYGAVDNTLSQLVSTFPTKTIAVITPIPEATSFNGGTSSGGYTLQQVVDAIIQVCNKYSIPVMDLYRNSGLFPWNSTANNTYFKDPGTDAPDGLHPNDAGHKVIAYQIRNFLEKLVGINYVTNTTGSALLVSDAFNRANASVIGTADTGQIWSNLQGTFGISSNRLSLITGTGGSTYDVAAIESGSADVIVEATTYLQNYNGIAARITDANNFIIFREQGGTFSLLSNVNGTMTDIADSNVTYVYGAKMKMILSGSSVKCYVNDSLVIQSAIYTNTSATKHGVAGWGTTVYSYDDFKISAL